MPRLRTVALEEHAWTPALRDAILADGSDDSVAVFNVGDVGRRLLDLVDERLACMDDVGVDVQVLSITTPGTQMLPAAQAVPLARQANDSLARTVAARPDRFAAFATLPTPDPQAATAELRRSVTELGCVGAMLFPRTGDLYLDDDRFRPIFEAAAELRVPLYLHPQIVPRAVRDTYFSGFGDELDVILATGGWGWHDEAGIAALRLMLAGTFDRHPNLQLILGHWGEMLAFFSERADILTRWAPQLERRVGEYITGNVHVTAGGILSHVMLLHALAVMGSDRVLLATDYPFQLAPNGGARAFLESAPISPEDKVKIGSRNASSLLRLADAPAGA